MKQMLFFAACFCTLIITADSYSQDADLRQGRSEMTPAVLAEKLRTSLASLEHLDVRAEQRVSYLCRGTDAGGGDDGRGPQLNAMVAIADHKDEVLAVDVRISASMTRDSYVVKMWKGEMSQPITEVFLTTDDAVPTIVERQWYPVLDDYRTAKYVSPHRTGYDDPVLQSCLFQELETSVCATAEFFHTWLGDDSYQADAFQQIVALATLVPAQSEMYQGRSTYRVVRQAYERDEPELYRSNLQTFWIDSESYLLVGWRTELVDIQYDDHAAYQVVERHYDYPTPTVGPGERFPSVPVGSTTKGRSNDETNQS